MTREADGALRVSFRAGGVQEMGWHLFTWGTVVTVVAPEELREALAEMSAAVATHHSTTTTKAEVFL